MRCIIISLAFLLLAIEISYGATELKILIPENAIPAEETAALELQAGLKKLFGIDFPVIRGEAAAPAIRIGQSPETARLLGNLDFSELKPDEIILKTVNDNLILTGDRPRGSLYAVYELFEQKCGVRFWTAQAESWPRQKTKFTLPQLNYRYAPPFQSREAYYDLIQSSPQFAVKLRNNGHFTQIPEEWGGHLTLGGWCHTFSHLVPPEKFFISNPEYFAEYDGRRVADSQLCLTNRNVRRQLIRSVLDVLQTHPDLRIISVSQNDNQRFCRCANCEAFVRIHGNQSDLLIDAVNEVAAEVEQHFPKTKVETLAYQYTRQAPRTIRPRNNVIVRLCSIECDFSAPLDSSVNIEFSTDVRNWSKTAAELYIWNYVTNFTKYYLPHPNWKGLARDLRFFAQNGAVAVFEQGSTGVGGIADFADLRAWVIAKLLWNPSLDTDKLMEEFAVGYYGPAASEIIQYLDLMNSSIQPGSKLSCYNTSIDWLDDRKMAKAHALMEAAKAKVAAFPELLRRVEVAAVSINLTALLDKMEKQPETGWSQLLDRQLEIARAAGTERFSENASAGSYEALRTRMYLRHQFNNGPAPDIVRGRRWKSVSAQNAIRYREGVWCFIEHDSQAESGSALRIPNSHGEWASQLADLPSGNYEIYITIRCDSNRPEGDAAIAGIYDSRTQQTVKITIPAKKIAGAEYQTVKLGTMPLSPKQTVFCAPAVNPAVQNIWVDRYIFVENAKQ